MTRVKLSDLPTMPAGTVLANVGGTPATATHVPIAAVATALGVADGDKGDVVVSGSGGTWLINAAVLTAYGRTVTAAANAGAARTVLELGTAATSDTGDFDAAGVAAAAQAAAEATAAAALSAHEADVTTHGISTFGAQVVADADAAAVRTTIGAAATAHNHSAADLTSGIVPDARMPNLTGDVTTVEGAVATTIANSAVTNAKRANMADATVSGRALGAGTGVPTDLTAAQVRALATGNLLAVVMLTSGTVYTPTAGTTRIYVELVAGGGGGGGATRAASNCGLGGGGSGGGYAAKYFTGISDASTYAYAIGGAGAAGANTGGNGGAGGDTTFTGPGAVTVTAQNGAGGVGMTSGTSLALASCGDNGTLGSGGDINSAGWVGSHGIRLSGTVGGSGGGGSSPMGSGGSGATSQSAGGAGRGYGAGGGGAAAFSANVAGGAGTAGAIRIWEFS